MRNRLLIGAAVALALGLASCGDPDTVVEPFAGYVSYEFSKADVEAVGGWLQIAELEYNALDDTPGVQVWGDGDQDADDDGDGPGEPYARWNLLAPDDYRLKDDKLFIFLSDDDTENSRHYRVVISRQSLNL